MGKAGSLRDYGYITAPLVHGDWLIVAVGASEGHLMAFDKKKARGGGGLNAASPLGIAVEWPQSRSREAVPGLIHPCGPGGESA